ncbi:XAP-5 protein, putative [Plasmodium knowlesi strain H]|uniref:XAP-5 protein, putative n=3 Tax=Plasmodium knowlesi TaxID=5850 RepID=A0A5K1VLX6_PLAKH|nr:XAP-5 protein, putative [Plasmodium knowlesi strain H]OTN66926.1 putative XAP-5 protein [Plasmodium knowlesi]CAA9988530.1 XAP-5 protein, putative [Plasmodium knowlesi strain H]SBO21304.1 XAP-5 protein, putative [Plasmodium knowlesi strain H]SBO21761.1 XAP-5 protein, putative [Plasmodium knowlesi strain H]VVS78004.1 XAP-5 protein, putative [Plasmodium knowlesi strain H]|eukprot:XP_002259504.1 XAP-5 protein, putative [Plasmodium knowlesi strain H]
MNFRKTDNTADLIDSLINSENGKVQKYILERKRKEKEFLEKKENIKKKTMMAPKLNQMFVKNKNEDDKLISETVGLRTVHEYKQIKSGIYGKEKDSHLSGKAKEDKDSKKKKLKLSFCSDDEEENDNEDDDDDDNEEGDGDDYGNHRGNRENDDKEAKKHSDEAASEEENDGAESPSHERNLTSEGKRSKHYSDKNGSDKNDADKNLQNKDTHTKYDKNKPFKKIMKDPTVNTSFLKDKERDEQIELRKKELRELYFKLENEQKEKTIEITYSYYDGSGHRRKISVKQKTTIGQFINKCVDNLKNEFIHLRSASCETLMFVKEDIILPNYLTFYELIKNKAQGKTGPLFAFDAVENLCGVTDIRREKTDTHAGKLVEKKWYEKNKHIFPASKWEIYKPMKTYSTGYTDLFGHSA